ncbi:hypothetical protein GGI11_001388 [Coemansia sp. RSA 2049]|nr:hypothetical protein H4217_005406 [Coemansia sp. RSA 1939]KAJ2523615.1 hypothetical protein GGI11_001388 [Coemansia sp. RSA 2049]KAJ2610164.1 hypothetical protein EV177_004103 [Coemansia sp. RSA 1804]KAJ2693658.1 hypothetical protein GGH99_001053 [Coemansia sp. RSA 1285]
MISTPIRSAAAGLRAVYAGSAQRCLLSYSQLPRSAAASSAVVARRMYSLHPSSVSSMRAETGDKAKSVSPQELLDKKHPTTESEILSSMIDGELDYDTDMGATSVNNITAEQRARATGQAGKVARDATNNAKGAARKAAENAEDTARKTIENFSKRHL